MRTISAPKRCLSISGCELYIMFSSTIFVFLLVLNLIISIIGVSVSPYTFQFLDHVCSEDFCQIKSSGKNYTRYVFREANDGIKRIDFNRLEPGSIIDIHNLKNVDLVSVGGEVTGCPLVITPNQLALVSFYVQDTQKVNLSSCNVMVYSSSTTESTTATDIATKSIEATTITQIITESTTATGIVMGSTTATGIVMESTTATGIATKSIEATTITRITTESTTATGIVMESTTATGIIIQSTTPKTVIDETAVIICATTAGVFLIAFIILLVFHKLKIIKLRRVKMGDFTLDFTTTTPLSSARSPRSSETSFSSSMPNLTAEPYSEQTAYPHPYPTRFQKRLINA